MSMREPWDDGAGLVQSFEGRCRPDEPHRGTLEHFLLYQYPVLPLYLAIRLYQSVPSSGLGAFCPMVPHCSGYAVQALAGHGAIKGLAVTADRTVRCGKEVWLYQRVETSDGWRYFDPVPGSISRGD